MEKVQVRTKKRTGSKAGSRGAYTIAASRGKGIDKLMTGIHGLDEILEGGVPKGRAMLLVGSTGTGKTVFLNEFLYRGITMAGENGVFVTMEERVEDIVKNVRSFGWNYPALIKQGKLVFVDGSVSNEDLYESGIDYNFRPLLERIKYAVKKVKAKRVCIDALDALFSRFTNKEAIRSILFMIVDELKRLGVTCMMSSEKAGNGDSLSRDGVAEFVTDAVLDLDMHRGQQQFIRTLFVRKVRGTGYRSGVVEYDISDNGIRIYPKIPVERRYARTSFSVRKQFGIPGLDNALGGGIPQGHMILVSGNTGAGKTLFCLNFLNEGIRKGEKAVYVAMEEPVPQVKKTAAAQGFNFTKYEKSGDLTFVSSGLIDVACDKLLYDIVDAVTASNAKRVVVDSISSLESATMNADKVREFLLQLANIMKAKGVTTMVSYLVGAMLGASKGQLLTGIESNAMRLSSVVDGLLILRYVERGQRVKRLVNVLKLRGCDHSKDIFEFRVEATGVVVRDRYEE